MNGLLNVMKGWGCISFIQAQLKWTANEEILLHIIQWPVLTTLNAFNTDIKE